MNLEQWFAVPIWYDYFKGIENHEYVDAINFCNSLSLKSDGRRMSNRGGWQSNDFYYRDIVDTPLQVFFKQIEHSINEVQLDLGIQRRLFIGNMWININNLNNSNVTHAHPNSSISGVFYLTKNNSNIVFTRSLDINKHHLDWIGSNGKTPLSVTDVSYTPQQGQYLFFPSWLQHRVEPNPTKEDRISIAFNFEM
jgi:uncharacterized protein (TIGR02466 family)